MIATVTAYRGSQDGIRFGDLAFDDGERRHFLRDKLNDTVRLWRAVRGSGPGDERPDRDPARLATAHAAILEYEGSSDARIAELERLNAELLRELTAQHARMAAE